MRFEKITIVFLFIGLTSLHAQIRLHPKNNHYFEYKNQATVLITSGEHYGAVINLDFDFETYLATLHRIGLNHTRIFLGDYVEEPNAFCIEKNTLAPAEGRFICPWLRSNVPGFSRGGNKFDLDRWNPAYFERLHQFMSSAQEKDIIVEAVLFFAGYLFQHSPLHHSNNINKSDPITAKQYLTLGNGNILTRQRQYCQKLVQELNQYDNLIFNVANEPWFDNQEHPGFASPPPLATKKWIQQVSDWIVETERALPKKHLISLDYTNEGQIIPENELNTFFKNISVFNHHYDRNAWSVKFNYHRTNHIMSFNETGLMPPVTAQYRIQGWKYIFSGGALYNNLDFTFQVGHEDGSGGTNFTCEWYNGCTDPEMKYQLAALLRFMNSIQFINMKPDYRAVALNYGDENIYPLVWEGHQYAVYFEGGSRAKIKLHVPPGTWQVKWLQPSDLKELEVETVKLQQGSLDLIGPKYEDDILLYVHLLNSK